MLDTVTIHLTRENAERMMNVALARGELVGNLLTDLLVAIGAALDGSTRPDESERWEAFLYDRRTGWNITGPDRQAYIDRLSSQSPGGEKPTGTIFELDMFREKLAREAGVRRRVAKSYHDGDPIFQTMLAWSAQLDEFAAELKTLIDNCQKQYCSQSPGGRKGDGEADGLEGAPAAAPAFEVVTPSDDARVAATGILGNGLLPLHRFKVGDTLRVHPYASDPEATCWTHEIVNGKEAVAMDAAYALGADEAATRATADSEANHDASGEAQRSPITKSPAHSPSPEGGLAAALADIQIAIDYWDADPSSTCECSGCSALRRVRHFLATHGDMPHLENPDDLYVLIPRKLAQSIVSGTFTSITPREGANIYREACIKALANPAPSQSGGERLRVELDREDVVEMSEIHGYGHLPRDRRRRLADACRAALEGELDGGETDQSNEGENDERVKQPTGPAVEGQSPIPVGAEAPSEGMDESGESAEVVGRALAGLGVASDDAPNRDRAVESSPTPEADGRWGIVNEGHTVACWVVTDALTGATLDEAFATEGPAQQKADELNAAERRWAA